MPCYHPWKPSPSLGLPPTTKLPCGQCVGCRLERSRQWAIRCMHEAKMNEENTFLNLTYRDEDLPPGHSLDHEDWQDFMKRLRRFAEREARAATSCTIPPALRAQAVSPANYAGDLVRKYQTSKKFRIHHNHTKLSFYMCGEYGERTKRPHYHACVFGYRFKDEKREKQTATGHTLYTSKNLDKLWSKGNTWTGKVTFESAAYVARYVMKKINRDKAKRHYEITDLETGEIRQRAPEYNRMSLRPGIGKSWYDKYQNDAYPEAQVVVRGHKTNTPRYYDKQRKKTHHDEIVEVKKERLERGILNLRDNSQRRLDAKERVKKAQLGFLKRNAH